MKKKIAIQIAASLAAALLAAALPAPAQTPSTAKPGAPAGRKEQVKPAPAGSPYHFSAADWGRMILFRNAAPETSVLPNPAALPAGWYVDIDRLGAGAVTILPPPGAMLDGSPHGALRPHPNHRARIRTDGRNYSTLMAPAGNYVFSIGDFTTCDGSADNTSAIQGVYDTVDGKPPNTFVFDGSEIDWPKNGPACIISSTIKLQSFTTNGLAEIVVKGGPVVWAPLVPGGNPFEIDNCFHCTFEDFHLVPQNTMQVNAIGTAFLIGQLADCGMRSNEFCGPSSGNLFLNNLIDGFFEQQGTGGGVNICFDQATPANVSGNATNDQMQFYGNTCRFYTSYAWQIDGPTDFSDVFVGNFALGVTSSMGTDTSLAAVNDAPGAAFTWIGGWTNANATADFLIGSNANGAGNGHEGQNAVAIKGDWSENSTEFVIVNNTGTPNNTITPVALEDDSVFSPGITAGHCVTDNTPGPLTVIGGSYGMGGLPCDFFMNPSSGSDIYGQITTVAMTGTNSQATPILSTGTIGKNKVEVADNIYTDSGMMGNAVPPATPETAGFAGNVQSGNNVQASNDLILCGLTPFCETLTAAPSMNRSITVPDASGKLSLNVVDECITASCTVTTQVKPITVYGRLNLSGSTVVTITGLPYGNSNFSCTGSDATTASGYVSFTAYVTGGVTINLNGGASTDQLRYTCVGNS